MTKLIYEQPLNEKTRNYLRLEYLEQQLQMNLTQDYQHRCFYPLFSLCDLAERCDYRSEVLKDLDKQILLLSNWKNRPQIDQQQVEKYLSQLSNAKKTLQISQRPGSELKQDRFLMALRQRFNMPGACCNFDLPQLHYWLAKPWDVRQQEYSLWLETFKVLLAPISQILELIRLTTEYTQTVAKAGFYQGSSHQALSLIRVQLDSHLGCYPTISGHKNRYAIHFVKFDQQKHSDQAIKFKLATCI